MTRPLHLTRQEAEHAIELFERDGSTMSLNLAKGLKVQWGMVKCNNDDSCGPWQPLPDNEVGSRCTKCGFICPF